MVEGEADVAVGFEVGAGVVNEICDVDQILRLAALAQDDAMNKTFDFIKECQGGLAIEFGLVDKLEAVPYSGS